MKKTIFTIFGSTGDLSYRKLMPAFFNLFSRGLVEEDVLFLAIGRREWDRERYLDEIRPWVEEFARYEVSDESFAAFAEHIDYFQMEFTIVEDFQRLFKYYNSIPWTSSEADTKYIFYLAVSPNFFTEISTNLAETGCLMGTNRVIVEKPFGEHYDDAKKLNQDLQDRFGEDEIYHIDHYLGKPMVQNLISIRKYNPFFSAAWNKDYIQSVQINAIESVDIGDRGAFYDATGALKDMVQSHLFQVMSVVAMELDADSSSSEFVDAQAELFQSLRPPADDIKTQLAIGQYEGYLSEDKVNPDSRTETFAATKLYIDNERWEGVPFYLRTGKALNEKRAYVSIVFKKVNESVANTVLQIEIQPQEGVAVQLIMNEAGEDNGLKTVTMEYFEDQDDEAYQNTPEAYERLLYASYLGRKDFFTPWVQIENSWSWIHDLREKRDEAEMAPEIYTPGSTGIESQNNILEDGDKWY